MGRALLVSRTLPLPVALGAQVLRTRRREVRGLEGSAGEVEGSLHARAQRCYTHGPPVGPVMSCLLGQA